MILKDLLDEVEFDDVWSEIINLYYDDETEERKNELYDDYRSTFYKVQNMQPKFDGENFYISIDKTFEWYYDEVGTYNETDEYYWNVHGINKDSGESYALEFSSWDLWLGWDIDREQLKNMGKNVYMAHILWEMTYIGFEEEEIQELIDDLKSRLDNIRDELRDDNESWEGSIDNLENEDNEDEN